MINANAEETTNENPFGKPIREFFWKIKNIHWTFPLIPQIIQFAVLSFVLSVLILLYLTIGIAFHCYAMFESLRIDAINGIKLSNEMISKSAYALASGIYLVLAAPFWVVLLPFRLIGWLASLSWCVFALALAALAVTICFVIIMGHGDAVVSTVRSVFQR